ncbi:sugar kinase [Methanosarcina sp. 2.H.T.1A.6]|uniref:carbohydrate kinase family protein n=1 Tax=unclassified Methanosarcina TaxID=2644672 RepID=UPI000621A6F6|nr:MULTISPECIES: carbohydrate kinase family protein [unclassified Methanosarcina]KKG14987.1 sugar kinase [Methanosarcina sp. 2.H.T.1A.3]KKG20594.1 sugar kinase [Methanosarcina sp. 2.H.T.1A.8]KKG22003.1 sugar kinase [Methanosarcina sp. 2.H.T.1A.6]KKG28640.1 sugar kinase [Methanosarcina sp. 2.H.T.1A.15]
MDRVISVVGHIALDYIVDVEKIAGLNESSPVIDYEEYPGGGAANIAVAIAKLGGKSQLISPVGMDFSSSGYEKLLKEACVDLSRLYSIEDLKLSKAFIFTDREDNQTTYFYWGASSKFKELEPEPADFVHLATADCVYNAKIAQIAGFVSFDPGQDLVTYSKEKLETILAHTDILFANKHEIRRVSEMTGKTFSELRAMIDVIVVTYDSEGSKIYTDNDEWAIPVVSVKAVDPTGAGDAYRAGFLLAYTRGYSLPTCGKIGSTVASFAVQTRGCQTGLPTWEEMRSRYEASFGKLDAES